VNYPKRVPKVMVLGICPTLAMYSKADLGLATSFVHWSFSFKESNTRDTDWPESKESALLFMGGRHAALEAFDPDDFEEYARVLGAQKLCMPYVRTNGPARR